MKRQISDKNRWAFLVGLIGLMALLGGCEAKLDLSAVEASKKNTIARYDQFQAAARSDLAMVIVGNRGTILVSKDQGASWIRQSLPGNSAISFPALVDIEVCPNNQFVALDADRKIWISDDQAENWTAINIPTEEEVLDMTCTGDGNLWVVGSFTLMMESTDFGKNWTDKSIAEDAMFSRIQFVDNDHGIVTGEFGAVYTTDNAGKSWAAANLIPNEFYPMASLFISPERGWVGGLQGIIFGTEDGGQNWTRQQTGTAAPIYNIFSVKNQTYAIGEQGTILALSGNKWHPVKADTGFGYLRAAVPIEEDKFLIAGGNGLIKLLNRQDLKE